MSHAPKVIVGALGIVCIANAWMIWSAISHPSAPASADHWAEGLAANEAIAERRASEALGWRVTLDPCVEGTSDENQCTVRLGIVDAEGDPVAVSGGRLKFERGDTAAYDRELEVRRTPVTGQLEGEWNPAVKGLYAVRIELHGGEGAEGPAWNQRREVQLMETER